MGNFGILVGGGPAPGINGVIGAATRTALHNGAEVVGILSGFRWLIEGPEGVHKHVRTLSLRDVSHIHRRGGSILGTARANPTEKPAHLEQCVKSLDALGVDRLVTIGGDDTAFSAQCLTTASQGRLQVVHVPKTIDNDLPLPFGIPTFGHETARQRASEVVETIAEDCRTTGRWFFVEMMGRHAGHLTLGAGWAAGAHVSLIAEEYPEGAIRLDDVVRVLEGAIVKRLADGSPDGVAVVAEGIAERIEPDDFEVLKNVARDEHGHIRLPDVPFGQVLADAVKTSLAGRGVKVAIGTKDVGYELRCVSPCAFDREYTRDLGVGAVRSLLSGVTGALITRQEGRTVPIPFSELMDSETGRTKVRMVDIETESFQNGLELQSRVTAADLEDPKRLERIAEVAHLSSQQARARYAPLA
jgi:6-phosphofructokinase